MASQIKVAFSNPLSVKPSKKILLLIIALCLLLILLSYLVASFVNIATKNKSTKIEHQPQFLFDITKGRDNLKSPLGVATSENRLYITDSGNGQVVVVDLEGHFLFAFDVLRSKNRKSFPVGIATDDAGNIYVSDLYEHMIKIFSSDGEYLRDFPSSSSLVKKPLALTYAHSKIYITDIGDQTVKIFNRRGSLLNKFGQPGTGNGQFAYPNGIAVAEDGTIFVADSNNGRVQIFDSHGSFLRLFEGKLSLPRGVVVDKSQRVHVTDALFHKVFVFDKKGNFLFSYGNGKAGLGTDLAVPNGIAFNDKAPKLFITDRGKDCVSVWKY